ncbi:efflux RND transporter periplasmic adaptor subunit [Desulfosporosinus sp. BG]|uniref:HlyD family secretion protein n=1 Tax=Desulfosporosinus sp. BG TaxID=1633135 RepID=UPI00083A93A9|nr:efflux RND transporter periplasmic adaptor subunit [Desulfosporosinus sp. BG]ODA40640.1 RND family efflux transporter, MFP subunit [Desulfosporosinus sp. BG]
MKRVIPITLLAVLLLGGCSQSSKPNIVASATQTTPQPQEVYIMTGKIEAEDQAAVTSKISAKVAQIAVDVGSQVKQGDPIIILDTNDIQAQVRQAETAVLTAQANLSSTLAGSRPEQIDQAQASLDSTKQSYDTVKTNFDRMQALYDQGAASHQQLETAQTQQVAAEAQYKSDQDQLSMLKQGATKETISIGQKQVEQAQAALEVTKTQLNNGTIVAPISGTVIAKNINAGELATPGTALVSIVNTESLYVNAYLPSRMVGQVKPGQQVIVKVSEIPDKKFEGEITVVNAEVDSLSKNVLVKVALKNPDSKLKKGMFVEIALKK